MASVYFGKKRRASRRNEHYANMRAAKAQKRMENPPEHEPKMQRWNRFEITVRDRLTGETGSFELRSLRDMVKRLSAVVKYLQ